ncbi:MAG: CHAD domain-containing protein [Puniceicoccales bacterium]
MKTNANFSLPLTDAGRGALKGLKESFALQSESKERRRWTILDTFDWRLLSANRVLLRDRKQCELHRDEGDELVAEAELPTSIKNAFAGDFPEGPLRTQVTGPLSIRAVMPRAEFIREVERFCIVNKDGKTTVRVELETLLRPVPGQKAMPFQRVLRVIALKGYEAAAERTANEIATQGLAPSADTRHYAFAALEASGVVPLDYTSKIKLTLSPDQSAREACTQILVSSWEQMEVNVDGMLADIDSEFLHDYRVALRRTRSLLQLVKGVYTEEDVLRFKQDLGDVMRGTNRLRDLDVYLLEQDAYAKLLPPALRDGLGMFFADLKAERGKVFKKFQRDFQGAAVKGKLNAWQAFLAKRAAEPQEGCPDGELPVSVLARKLLRKRFNRIIKDGRKITDETPDEAVHELRIQFKKLRYLLEFFKSLFDGDELDFLIKRSRKMQSVLGTFNDLCVQQATITQYLSTVNLKRSEAVQLCAALGALVAELERKRHITRRQYKTAFATLDDPKVLAIADHLFREEAVEETPAKEPVEPPVAAPVKKATRRKAARKTTKRATKKTTK